MESVMIQVGLQAATLLVQGIAALIESRTSNATVTLILNLIQQWMPVIVKAFPQMLVNFQSFISILQGDDTLTDDQLNQLTQIRADLEAARKAANDAAAAAGEGA